MLYTIRFTLFVLLICQLNFSSAVQQSGTKLDIENRVQACMSCHGDQGKSSSEGYYPRIAGKPAGYLFNQLVNFREGYRQHSGMRHMVQYLSDDYLKKMASYFSQQHPPYSPPATATVSATQIEMGKKLALQGEPARKIPACASCHGAELNGVDPVMPGLLGLPRDYLNAQIGNWLNGQRKAAEPDCMNSITKLLSLDDINAITAYLASQPVPTTARPAQKQSVKPPILCGTHLTQAGSQSTEKDEVSLNHQSKQTQRGAYLAKLSDCEACHTATGKKAYSGGKAIETPFGKIYTSNLTPAKKTGIGNWTPDEFYRAMHEGIGKHDQYLYPAFPFTNFTLMSKAEIADLFAFLKSQPAVENQVPKPKLRFPYNQRYLLAGWRLLYFQKGNYEIDPKKSAQWNRGAYLVQGPGHCNACHTPRNALGGLKSNKQLSGALIPVQNWYAPSLNGDTEKGLGKWTEADLVQWLGSGKNDVSSTYGPMAEVIEHSLQYLTQADLQAIAHYLKSLKPTKIEETSSEIRVSESDKKKIMQEGQKVYTTNCADCHGDNGEGKKQQYPSLAQSHTVRAKTPVNTIQMVLNGGYGPSTNLNPYPYGMPPFRASLSAQDIANVTSYIRNAWGNQAGLVRDIDVKRLR